mmetsp:Transcript_158/g.480  ORF Transcript_158/g.480 Transcript_158/m.480 type:complete len:251 (-) Transcript_158:177-929(-)
MTTSDDAHARVCRMGANLGTHVAGRRRHLAERQEAVHLRQALHNVGKLPVQVGKVVQVLVPRTAGRQAELVPRTLQLLHLLRDARRVVPVDRARRVDDHPRRRGIPRLGLRQLDEVLKVVDRLVRQACARQSLACLAKQGPGQASLRRRTLPPVLRNLVEPAAGITARLVRGCGEHVREVGQSLHLLGGLLVQAGKETLCVVGDGLAERAQQPAEQRRLAKVARNDRLARHRAHYVAQRLQHAQQLGRTG